MTTKTQMDASITTISSETEHAVREFVRIVTLRLDEALKDRAPEWDEEVQWERGTDGHFRESTKRTRKLWRFLNYVWLRSQPEYDALVGRMKSDAILGPHLDRLVGTCLSTHRVDADGIIQPAIYAMLDNDGNLAFKNECFDREWRKVAEAVGSKHIPFKTIAPLPNLHITNFPLRLNDEVVLDRLTDEEVTRCCQVGVLRPDSPRYSLIDSDVAIGIRRTRLLPKLIKSGLEPPEVPEVADEGKFGARPLSRDDLLVDDVLSALRLFKHTQVRTSGRASWSDSPWLSSGTSYRVQAQWPYGGQFELSEGELPLFSELWQLLENGAARFGFSIHRFNLAFDRGLLADRIVDLIIAAESLLLGDLDEKYRGELRYRFALRAAIFIDHPEYSQRDVFRVMRSAYDARSAIVHGGLPKKNETCLPDNKSATLQTFTDTIEELVRLGLRKALSMKDDSQKLRQSGYWDDLVFPEPDQT